MKRILSIAALTLMLATGCYYDNEETLYPNQVTTTTTGTAQPATYVADIKPLMDSKCATSSCHVSGSTFPDLSAYAGLKNNIDRVKTRAIIEKSMPAAGPLSNAEIAKLQSWIDAGSLNN